MKNRKEISDQDLDLMTSDELARILICHNDGQGDTICYSYDDIYRIISDSDIKIDGEYINAGLIIADMKPHEIMWHFCSEFNPNMAKWVYFDISINKWCEIKWV